MSARSRRHYGSRGVSSRRRRKVWVGPVTHITAALASAGFEWVDLAQPIGAPMFSDAATTVVRTHLRITTTSTPVLGDTFIVAVGIIKGTEVGANVVGAIQPDQVNYPWAYQNQYVFNGTYNGLGGNTIDIDIRAMRKIANDFESYAIGIKSGAAAATSYRLWGRTLVALPLWLLRLLVCGARAVRGGYHRHGDR